MNGKFPPSSKTSSQSSMSQLRPTTSQPSSALYLNGGNGHEDMYLLESAARPPPPPPAPPSTPVVKQATQKHHHQLLQQLPKMLANGISLSRPEDYVWLDPSGRPTSPPRPLSPQNKAQSTRKVAFELVVNDNLGLMIRGGIEYGLGIYITGVDEESAAFRNGLRVGDEIVSVNGNLFERLTHDEAVSVLKSCHRLSFHVRYIGKVPHSSLLPKNHRANSNGSTGGQWLTTTSSGMNIETASAPSYSLSSRPVVTTESNSKVFSPPDSRRFGDGAESVHEMSDDFGGRHLFTNSSMNQRLQGLNGFTPGGGQTGMGYDETSNSPELSMVLEKAMVLLNSKEFSALRRILAEYEASEINIDTFAESLLQLIRDQEKASFFTEIREVVRQEDLIRFDRLIFGRKGNLFDLLLADAASAAAVSPRSMSMRKATDKQQMQRQPINAIHFGMENPLNRFEYMYGDEDEEDIQNGFDGPSVKVPPLYVQRRDSYDRPEVHPSIAGFPSHARKANRSVTFKGSLTIHIPKCCSSLGIAIEGGTNTLQPLPRIISIQPNGAAYQSQDLRVGQLISEVDGYKLTGLPHEAVAKLIAECFAKRDRNTLTLVVMDQKLTPAEMRRSFMQPQS